MKLYTGQPFNRLTIFAFVRAKGTCYYWLCRCVCGMFKILRIHQVTSGRIKSCGCLQRENIQRSKAMANRANEIYGMQKEMKQAGYL